MKITALLFVICATLFPAFGWVQVLSSDSLILHLPFNGNAKDISGNGYHGIVNGATLTTDEQNAPNSAYYFNGNNTSIIIPGVAKLDRDLQEFTVLLRLQPENLLPDFVESTNGHANYCFFSWHKQMSDSILAFKKSRLWASWSNYRNFYPVGSLTAQLFYFFGGCDPTTGYAGAGVGFIRDSIEVIGKWHTVAFVCKGNTIKSYFNCMLGKSLDVYQPVNKTCDSGSVQITLGNVPTSTTLLRGYKDFKGKISDLRIYSRAFTENEINTYANSFCVPVAVRPVMEFKTDPCFPNKVLFSDLSETNGVNVIKRIWRFGSGDSTSSKQFAHTYASIGIYPVQLTIFTDSISSYTLDTVITISQVGPKKFLTAASGLVSVCKGGETLLSVKGAVSYHWLPCTFLSDCFNSVTKSKPDSAIIYRVAGIDNNGCTDTISYTVTVIDNGLKLFVPTAFTPNGDGLNDDFGIFSSLKLQSLQFEIFNRWGQKVFSTSNQDERWLGHSLPGMYAWHLRYLSGEGCAEQYKKGIVTLIR